MIVINEVNCEIWRLFGVFNNDKDTGGFFFVVRQKKKLIFIIFCVLWAMVSFEWNKKSIVNVGLENK